jgi:hypothetical protein
LREDPGDYRQLGGSNPELGINTVKDLLGSPVEWADSCLELPVQGIVSAAEPDQRPIEGLLSLRPSQGVLWRTVHENLNLLPHPGEGRISS